MDEPFGSRLNMPGMRFSTEILRGFFKMMGLGIPIALIALGLPAAMNGLSLHQFTIGSPWTLHPLMSGMYD